MHFLHMMGTSFTNLRFFFYKFSSIVNFLFPLFHETLYAGCIIFFAVASGLLTHAVFQLVVFRKTASSTCVLQPAKKVENGGC
jgi:hypothetical protein